MLRLVQYTWFCLALWVVGLLWPGQGMAGEVQSARIVDLDGQVEFNKELQATWKVPQVGQVLQTGDRIRTGAHSRASLLLADESLIKLKEQSEFVVGEVAPSAAWTLLDAKTEQPPSIKTEFTLHKGGAWFLNKNKSVAITFKTPTAEIGIRGTELVAQLGPEQTLQVAALEGSARIQNPQGELVISSGEEAITRTGAAPVKQMLLHPDNAVQWVIAVPDLWTSRALRQSGPGWDELNQGRFADALARFEQTRSEALVNRLGQVAALMGLRRYQEAGVILAALGQAHPDHPLLVLQQAWFDLMTGQLLRAHQALVVVTGQQPQEVMGWQLRALTALALDRRQEMQEAARQAMETGPDSATSWLIQAYVQQAQFLLEDAERSVQKALTLEAENVPALIALARLQFGGGRTDEALATMNRAARLAPDHAEINNLHGFIFFALRQVEEAITAFDKAIRQDSTQAEAHMGLGLAWMRQGNAARAFEEITTAVLLDPRRSLFRSYWAKMLYQVNRHEKALDVLQMARTLDPRDPTPLLYEAIILRDLNRPTQAIQTINAAIALNDNRAVYRSRFLLDGDLAVKNVDLSKLFNQLELGSWAKNKAVASVRQDYTNASGHLFYAGALADEEGRSWARNTENLLARLLQPANRNTFNSFNDYTTFVEQPGVDVDLSVTVGNHATFNQTVIASGAAPKQDLAYQVGYVNNDTDGWRKGHFDHARSVVGYMKWDATQNGSVMLAASQTDTWQGDKLAPRFEWDSPLAFRDNLESTTNRIEGGYHHHFAPGSDLLLHAARIRTPLDLRVVSRLGDAALAQLGAAGFTIDDNAGIHLTSEFYQLQGEYLYKRGANQLLTGVIHYGGSEVYDNAAVLEILAPVALNVPYSVTADQKRLMDTVFVQDIYQINSALILEGDLHFDWMKTGSSTNRTTWSETYWSPRLGLTWTPYREHTLRLAGFRSLLPFSSDRLDPSDIAGISVHRNGTPGSLTDEGQLVWEYETEQGFWSAGLFYADREYHEVNAARDRVVWGSRIRGVELVHNRLLGMGFGLSARYRFENVMDPRSEQSATVNRDEHLVQAGLKWVDSSGWSAQAKETFRALDFESMRTSEMIWISGLQAAYEFPGKRGSLQLDIDNLFDQHFNWVTDAFVFQGRNPAREMFLTLNLFF